MADQELLQAIGQMMDVKLAEQDQRAGEKLQAITERLDTLVTSVEEIRDSTNYIAEWVERLENSFKAHEINTAG